MQLTPSPLRALLCFVVIVAGLLLAGCEFTVPLSTKPDRAIDDRLLGDWISPGAWMKIRAYDGENYVVYHNGTAYRAWHSSVAGLPLITAKEIESKPAEAKFAYLVYEVADDGRRLNLRVVSDEVVSKKINDTTAMRKAIEQHAKNPQLLSEVFPFSRMK